MFNQLNHLFNMSVSFVINIFVYSCGFDDTHQLVLRDYIFSRNSEQVRHGGVVCKYLHVAIAQPEVCINISLSDEDDIIEFSVFY